MNLKRAAFVPVAACIALAGCESVPVQQVEILPIKATVTNASGPIGSIQYQECGASSSDWTPLAIGPIPSGGKATFDLPAPCVNLQAFYADGKLAGTQTGIRREFPFSWVIR